MTTARDITIYQGQAFALSLDYAGTAGRGQRMHIRLADSTATVVQILTHNGDANARVIFDTDALEITIGASVSAGWVVLADRVEWVYDIEDYDLADEDDCVIPYRGKVIVRGNRTRASDVTPSDQMPSGDGRYVRFDGAQGLSAGQQLQARENIGATLGTGDVVGPASATDDRIAAFDGVTGKLIKQSSYTITTLLAAAWARASHTGTQLASTISDFSAAALAAVQGALDLKAPLASPVFTGTPAAPTPTAGDSSTRIATTAFVGSALATAVTGLLEFIGDIDASANPNYPAGFKGDTYVITVAGKVGGASGKSVDIGDLIIAKADNASGTEASVGTSWIVLEHNLAGALLAANNLSDLASASTARSNLGLAIGIDVQAYSAVLAGTTAAFTGAQETKLAGIEASADVTDAGNVGAAIDGATAKTTPVDADTVPLIDSAAGNVLKKLSWANIKATAKTYFDTLYAAITHASSHAPGGSDALPWTTIHGRGVAASRPAAVAGNAGYIYYSTDTEALERSTGSAWETIAPAGGGGGSGDVVGPASATDNAIARFDTTTGKLVQDSGVTVSDVSGSSVTLASTAGNALALAATAPAATTGASVAGKAASLTAGAAVASTDTAGAAAGGSVRFQAGNAARLTSGNADSGHYEFLAATGIGTGVGSQILQYSNGSLARPAYAFDISGNRAYGFYYSTNRIIFSMNGAQGLTLGDTTVTGAAGTLALSAFKAQVDARTGSVGYGAAQYMTVSTNEGAASKPTITLPSAAAGGNYEFVIQDADGMRLTAASGDTIRVIDKVTSAAGYIESTTIGSVVRLVAINATEWIVMSIHGVWTDGTFSYDDTANTTP